jgi:hypothetical protein
MTVTVDQFKVLTDASYLRILALLMEWDNSISGIRRAPDLQDFNVDKWAAPWEPVKRDGKAAQGAADVGHSEQ